MRGNQDIEWREFVLQRVRSRNSRLWMFVLCIGLLIALPARAPAGLKLKAHPTQGNAAQLTTMFRHMQGCMGRTTLNMAADGTITIGPAPPGGDNKFAQLMRTIIGGANVEVEVGRNIPRTTIGKFNMIVGGADNGKTTGTQTIDLDNLEKQPTMSTCGSTLCAKLMHELWEVHYAKTNFARDGMFPNAHADAVRKENEVLADQNPRMHGQLDETLRRAPALVGQPVRVNADGTPNPNGDYTKTTFEMAAGFKCSDGTTAWEVKTYEVITKTSDGSLQSGPRNTKVEIETGTGANVRRVVVTNPDPFIQYFTGNGSFVSQFENYPGDPQSRPGHLALGTDGALYISEEIKNTVEIRDVVTQGFLGRIVNSQLSDPQGVNFHFDLAEIFVASFNTNSILIFQRDGTQIGQITNPALSGPTDIVLADDGRFDTLGAGGALSSSLYVCNTGQNNVLRLGMDGSLLGMLSSPDLMQPSGLARDPDGNVYVSSFGTDSVDVFDSAGNEINRLTDPSLSGPQGIALSLRGGIVDSLYVTSKNSKKVVTFKSNGTVTSFTHQGTECPKGAEIHDDVTSPGTLMDVTAPPTFNLRGGGKFKANGDVSLLHLDITGVPNTGDLNSFSETEDIAGLLSVYDFGTQTLIECSSFASLQGMMSSGGDLTITGTGAATVSVDNGPPMPTNISFTVAKTAGTITYQILNSATMAVLAQSTGEPGLAALELAPAP